MMTPDVNAWGHFDTWLFKTGELKNSISKIKIRGEQKGQFNSSKPSIYFKKFYIDIANREYGYEQYAEKNNYENSFKDELIINDPIRTGRFPLPEKMNLSFFK